MKSRSKMTEALIGGGLVLLLVFTLVGQAEAGVIFAHEGNTDPATEGWTFAPQAPSAAVSVGPVTNDRGTGIDAWFFNDFGGVPGVDGGSYRLPLTDSQIAQASANGWKLSTRLRVVNSAPAPDGQGGIFSFSVSVAYSDGTTSYDMTFIGQEGSPDIQVLLPFDLGGGSYNPLKLDWHRGRLSPL